MKNIDYKRFDKSSDEELKNEFFKSKKDPNFKKLIDSLPINEDELYKYTSALKKVVYETNNDKENKSEQNEIPGFIYKVKVVDGKLLFFYDTCKEKKEELEEIEYLKNGYLFEVARDIRNAKLNDIYTNDKNRVEVIKWITKFIKEYRIGKAYKGLYLSGSFGSGKSYIVSACLNELSKNDKKVAMIYFPEFLRILKSSFNSDDVDFNEQFEYARKADLLLLDDIGAENVTSWSRDEILGPILQYRMDEKLPTFFTSNLSLEELEVHLSESKDKVDKLKAKRIIERIKFLTDELVLVSSNKRN